MDGAKGKGDSKKAARNDVQNAGKLDDQVQKVEFFKMIENN